MLNSGLFKKDQILSKIILNAQNIIEVDIKKLDRIEIKSFSKTQKNLIAKLIHLEENLDKRKPIFKKSALYRVRHKYLRLKEISDEKFIKTIDDELFYLDSYPINKKPKKRRAKIRRFRKLRSKNL